MPAATASCDPCPGERADEGADRSEAGDPVEALELAPELEPQRGMREQLPREPAGRPSQQQAQDHQRDRCRMADPYGRHDGDDQSRGGCEQGEVEQFHRDMMLTLARSRSRKVHLGVGI
jgi:hypothetical protein